MNSSYFRQLSRDHMKANLRTVLIASLVYTAIALFLGLLVGRLSGADEYFKIVQDAMKSSGFDLTQLPVPKTTPLGSLFTTLLELAASVLGGAYAGWCLMRVRGIDAGIRELFPDWRTALRLLGVLFLSGILIGLGFMLFIIPGVILLFRYALVVYLVYDQPEMGIIEIMQESGRLMKGHKMEYFLLQLSFIGWVLLAEIVESFIVVPIGSGFLNPYRGLASAYFYNSVAPQGAVGGHDSHAWFNE